MIRLTKKQVLMMYDQMTEETGGHPGIRDEGMLESALEAPFQTFAGMPLYSTIEEKAVRMGYGLIKNHPMQDGNKRIGTHAMLVCLALNNIHLHYTQEELYETILAAAGSQISYEEFLAWVLNHKEKI